MTTDETTSHSAMPPINGGQAAGYSHLTGETTSQSTDGTPSHSTRSPTDGNQVDGYKPPKNSDKVAGYNPAAEKLLAGHPKDAGQAIGYSHSTKTIKSIVQAAGYSARIRATKL